MRFEVRASKPIATELVTEPTFDRALDHAAIRIDDGFVVVLTDLDTGDRLNEPAIWDALADRNQKLYK